MMFGITVVWPITGVLIGNTGATSQIGGVISVLHFRMNSELKQYSSASYLQRQRSDYRKKEDCSLIRLTLNYLKDVVSDHYVETRRFDPDILISIGVLSDDGIRTSRIFRSIFLLLHILISVILACLIF